MTDLEMTKLCAEAMGYRISQRACSEPAVSVFVDVKHQLAFDPLHDDAQAMALVKKVGLSILRIGDGWTVGEKPRIGAIQVVGVDLNRAIVECVAKMQASKP